MRRESAWSHAEVDTVSIPYRFNETTPMSLPRIIEYIVSIPYRFNETLLSKKKLPRRNPFQFLIGSMRLFTMRPPATAIPRFNSL